MAQRGGITDEEFILEYLNAKYASEFLNNRCLVSTMTDENDTSKRIFQMVFINHFKAGADVGNFFRERLQIIFPYPQTTIARSDIKIPGMSAEGVKITGNPTIMKDCIRTRDPALFEEIEEKLSGKSRE